MKPLITAQELARKNNEAAAIIRGGNANGQTEWRDAAGRTLKEIELL